jgi:WD40 repeat protein
MGLADGRLILYNPQTNTQVAMVENVHQDSVNGSGVSAIVFGADGRLLATAGQNGQIMTWDVGRNGTVGGGDRLTITWGTGDPSALGARATYLLPSGSASALAFSPDGLLFAAGGPDGKIYLWAHPAYTNPGEMPVPIMTLTAHTTSVMRLFFSNDGSQLFSIGADGSSAVWGVSPVAG